MKKIILIAATALLLNACAGNTVKIKGTAPEMPDSTMVVLKNMNNDTTIDTAYVIDQKFSFKTNAEKHTMMIVALQPSMRINGVAFVAEPGTLNIEIGQEQSIGGTKLNNVLREFQIKNQEISEEVKQMMAEFRKIPQTETQKIEDARKEIDQYFAEIHRPAYNQLVQKTFTENKLNPLGMYMFLQYINTDTLPNIQQIEEYYVEYPEAQNFKPLTNEYQRLVNEEKTSVGKMFTDVTVRNIEDTQDVKLSEYVGRGKYVLVDFWASWCGPCIAAIPNLKVMQQKYGRKNFTVVGVNVWDTHEKAVASIKEKDLKWPQLFDNTGRGEGSTLTYAVRGIPTLILFSPSGEILLRTHNSKEVLDLLEKTIK